MFWYGFLSLQASLDITNCLLTVITKKSLDLLFEWFSAKTHYKQSNFTQIKLLIKKLTIYNPTILPDLIFNTLSKKKYFIKKNYKFIKQSNKYFRNKKYLTL